MSSVNIRTAANTLPAAPLPRPQRAAVARSVLFVLPQVIVTAATLVLFNLLTDLTAQDYNRLSVTLLASVILSLLTTPLTQLPLRRAIETWPKQGAAVRRGLRQGLGYAFVLALTLSALAYPVFIWVLHYPLEYYGYFAVLLLLSSLTWTFMAAFWLTQRYAYPALIFTVSYIILFALTYGAYLLDPRYTLAGYTGGIFVLAVTSGVAVLSVFGRKPWERDLAAPAPPELRPPLTYDLGVVLFQTLYTLALFLDKMVVWLWQSYTTWSQPVIVSPYTVGSFYGLVPIFAVATTVYFAVQAQPLVNVLYEGRLADIEARVRAYKRYYWRTFWATLLLALALLGGVALAVLLLQGSGPVLKYLLLVGGGTVFFALIVVNAAVLPLFGQNRVALLAVGGVIAAELGSILFLPRGVGYAGGGYLLGSLAGFLLSQAAVVRDLAAMDYLLMRYATMNSLKITRKLVKEGKL